MTTDNTGQFGKRSDTQQKGSQTSGSGNFQQDKQRASREGKKGAQTQSTQDKAKGGEHSSQND
jgi:general stress protein YciG